MTLLLVTSTSLAATLTVGSSGSADHTTIADAVAAAVDGDTLLLEGESFDGCVELGSLSLTLEGAGSDATVLTASDDCDALITHAGDSLTLRSLGLTAPGLSCLRSDGSEIVLDGVEVADCGELRAYVDPEADASTGGGLALTAAATLTITDSRFRDNMADHGGAVYAGGDLVLVVSGSSFDGNLATGSGGAVRVAGVAEVSIADSSFSQGLARGPPALEELVGDRGPAQALGGQGPVVVAPHEERATVPPSVPTALCDAQSQRPVEESPVSTLLFRVGRSAAAHPGRMIGLWLVAAALVVVASGAWGAELEDEFAVPGVDSQVATELLSEAGNDRAGLTAQVVVASTDAATSDLSNPSTAAAIDRLRAELGDLESVVGVAPAQLSPDGRIALLTIQYPVLEELDASDVDRLTEVVDRSDSNGAIDVEVGGDLLQAFDDGGGEGAEMIGLLVAIIVLLVAFGSVIAMGLPIGMALAGLALGVSAMALVAHLIEVPSWAPQMGTMIGLGVGIDYALFVVTRHREGLAEGRSIVDAAAHANATAGHSVVFAGGTVVIAILGLAFAGVPFMTAAGVATSVIVGVMVLASVTLLPALLGLVGHRIDRWSVRRRSSRTPAGRAAVGARWEQWGEHVSRHAAGYAIGVTALLLALTAPVLALNLGFPDQGSLPESRTERRAYDLVAEGFGPGANGPLVVAVDLAETGADAEVVVADLSRAVAADAGITAVPPAEIDVEAGVATIVAFPSTAPQDDATYETVQRLRSEVIPPVVDAANSGGPADSAVSAHVGGQTATFGDVADRVGSRLLLFISAVVALSFLLLTVVFRSVLVAAKAALLNLLSIGAAYGVLVAVFQWGWGMSLFGLEATVPIVSFIPMFMFAVLFGLSMDYEVFLLSRVREEYRATGDNDRSVIHGIAVTARVITSAALIMISVFGGFVLGEDPILKMMGLGLATAILVDATIVRLVLVPATMTLLGDRNWWLPAWLDRMLPHVDVDGPVEARLPEATEPDAETRDRELVDA